MILLINNKVNIFILRVWYSGLCWIISALARQNNLSDRRLVWLREQYLQLYHEDGYCCGPLAADAIRSFGGRDWSIAGMTQASGQPGETSGLRREVSMKVKKKHLITNQTFKVSYDIYPSFFFEIIFVG